MNGSTSSNPGSDLAVEASISVFDALERGSDAPTWILDGIRTAWLSGASSFRAVLIAVSENATFRVSVDGVPRMVVRLHRPGYVGDPANVRSELQWIEAVASETEISTPSPIRGNDGQLVQNLAGPDGTTWIAVAFEFVEGRILEEHEELAPHYTEIGRVTAMLHEHSRSWDKPDGFRRFNWDIGDMVGPAPRWGSWKNAQLSTAEHAVIQSALVLALEELTPLEKSPMTWGLIHSDLRPSNIMIDAGELSVIDFDDAGFSWYLYDFASALTFYEHREAAPEMAANWLSGYSQVLPLTRADLKVAAALSVVRRLTMLGWATTHREDALPPDLWNENLPGTVEVAERYCRDQLWLVDPG
jgi:Ser/Thr protein kinase RdoA (MazF antagonist)